MATMVSLQRRIGYLSDDNREREFFSRTLQHLTAVSGHHVEDWMIMSDEVVFGPQIGSGGLYVFSY
jgi:hypothetical protein